MKDFLPVFMSSWAFYYICYWARSLWWMNACLLLSVQVIECMRKMLLSCKFRLPPLFFSLAFTAALVRKVFDSQANNFPRCTSLFPLRPLPFLPLITLPALRPNSWNQRSVTHLLLLLSTPPQPPCFPTTSTLICSFIYLESLEQHKSRCLVTAAASMGVPPEGKPVSMTR